MNILGLEKKQVIGPKQILLTLKKDPGHCGMSAVIAPIGKNREVKIKNRKLIKISTKDGPDVFLEKMDNLERFNTSYQLLPKIKQVPNTRKRQSFLNTKQCSILKNALVYESSEFCQNFSHILYKEQITVDQNKTVTLETGSGDLRTKDVASNLNKHDRFVPNILRSTKMTENNFNNDSPIRFDQTLAVSSHGGEEQCKDNKNVKRKRKQVLGSLTIEKNEPNKSFSEIGDHNLVEESSSKNVEIIETKLEQEESKKCVEIKAEGTATAEGLMIDFCPSNDLYSADLDVSYPTHNLPCKEEAGINCSIDKSIRKIFAEFEVADYQNYIDCRDLGFDIDEMDKLLSSDIECSLTESSILDRSTKMMEYDVNGNDIDNHGNAWKKPIDKDKLKPSIQCKIEACYNDRSEPLINTSGRLESDSNLDALFSGALEDSTSYMPSKMNLWSTEFEDYYCSDNFQDFHHRSPGEDSCSTDTASESQISEPDSPQSLGLVLPKIGNLGCFKTPLVINDIVPDNVLSSDLKEFSLGGLESDDYTAKRSSDCSPTMKQYHPNSDNINDNNYCVPLPGIQLEKLRSNLQLYDRFDASFELFEDGNFLVDDMLNINCTFSKEDDTCESILANSKAKFDVENVSKMLKDIPDFDIENADDIEISKLLRLGNNHLNDAPSVPLNTPGNELSMDMATQSNTDNIFVWNDHNSQFGSMKFENPTQAQAEDTFNESTYSNASQGFKFLFENEVEAGDKDYDLSVSALKNVSSVTEEPCDTEEKYIDNINSSNQLSLPLWTEKGNMNELKTSESRSLLTQTYTCEDYSSTDYLSALSCDVTDSESGNNEDCSQVVEHSQSFHSQVTGYRNIEDTLYSYAPQDKNEAPQATVIDLDDEYSVADRRDHHLSELDSSESLDSYNRQSISYSDSSRNAASSVKFPAHLSKPKRGGFWKDLVKRSKSVRQNIIKFPCDFCEKRYRSEEALVDHINVTHRYRLSRFRYRDKKYVCDKCSKEYCIAGAIERHFKLHENYTLTCRICEKHFSEKVFLRRHVHSFHLDWKLQCNYCGRKFPRKNTLTQHHKRCHGLQDSLSESFD